MKEFSNIYEELTALNEDMALVENAKTKKLSSINRLNEASENSIDRREFELVNKVNDTFNDYIRLSREISPYNIPMVMKVAADGSGHQEPDFSVVPEDQQEKVKQLYNKFRKAYDNFSSAQRALGEYRLNSPFVDYDSTLTEEVENEQEVPESFDDKMDFLAADEQEAIDGYDLIINALGDDEANVKEQLEKIKIEEIAHKEYLEKVKADHNLEYTEPLEYEEE